MWLTWRYSLPAFLVPFVFVLSDDGLGLLLSGGIGSIAVATATSAVAVAALAVATGAWLRGPAGWPERVLFGAGALVLLVMEPLFIVSGVVLVGLGFLVHEMLGRRRSPLVS